MDSLAHFFWLQLSDQTHADYVLHDVVLGALHQWYHQFEAQNLCPEPMPLKALEDKLQWSTEFQPRHGLLTNLLSKYERFVECQKEEDDTMVSLTPLGQSHKVSPPPPLPPPVHTLPQQNRSQRQNSCASALPVCHRVRPSGRTSGPGGPLLARACGVLGHATAQRTARTPSRVAGRVVFTAAHARPHSEACAPASDRVAAG